MKNNSKNPKPLSYGSSVNAAAFRVSLEECIKSPGENYTRKEAQMLSSEETSEIMAGLLKTAISNEFDRDKYIVVGMVHGRDCPADQVHMHILVKLINKDGREHISTILGKLGIRLSSGGGENLGGSWKKYISFFTHNTPQARQAGKVQYGVKDYISTLTDSEIERILNQASHSICPAEKYVEDIGKAYKAFVEAYKNSGDISLAKKIEGKLREKAESQYERTVADVYFCYIRER